MDGFTVPSESLIIPATGVAGMMLVSGRGILTGYSLRETTGAATADVDILDGTTAGGMPLLPMTLNARESDRQWFGVNGPLFQNGLFANVTAGTIRGVLFVILQESITVDGLRVIFDQSSSGAFSPRGAEIDRERY